jgi:threonyl-tRNA synthetase
MRALILHTDKFEVKVIAKSNKPAGISPEEKKSTSEKMTQNLTVFFCVEENDTEKQLNELYDEIIKTSNEVKTKNIMIAPFVHLSKNIAKPDVAKKLYESLVKKFQGKNFNIKTSHFGYHKTLSLDVKGHPGSFRYREFY